MISRQEIARGIRQEYIDYVGRLKTGRYSSVTEKNPFRSNVLLRISSRMCGQEFGDTAGRPNPIVQKAWFIIRYTGRIIIARLYGIGRRHTGKFILHTWIDARSFEKGEFHNVYFEGIIPVWKQEGKEITYLADILPTYPYLRAVAKLISIRKSVYLKEEFLGVLDPIRAIIVAGKENTIPATIPRFMGLDIIEIIMEEIEKDQAGTGYEQAVLCSYMGERLGISGCVRQVVYPFENHSWERAMCEGLKKADPNIKTTGYALTFINPMYTCYSLSEFERERTTIPDIILTSGRQGRDMLIKAGFGGERIFVGGAARYPARLGNTVLIALSGGIKESEELLAKTIETFCEEPEINVIIKYHPTTPQSAHRKVQLPKNFSVTDDKISELLERVDIVLYTESTVCIEAAMKGIPVIHVKSDHKIDINILEDNQTVPSCGSPKEILIQTQKILLGKATKQQINTEYYLTKVKVHYD